MIGNRPTVFVVDDDHSVRNGLERLLKLKGYRVESFASAEEFLQEEITTQVACLVLDVNLPGLNGLDLQRFLMQRGVLLPIVFITGHGDIPTAVRAIKSGAVTFLIKPFHEAELVNEIENAFGICRSEFRQRSEIADIQHRYATLTERESEILSFVVSGKLNKQTAHELGIVENTVKVHRRRVMRKMQAESVAELVLMAQKLNLPAPTLPQLVKSAP
ncbi:MAG TPA: response regulator [Candidatus Angelobacter sp.]|nr:response regulator [Candidatus Angelobacter sp.]